MKHELPLKYGCNPHQKFASLTTTFQNALQLLNGTPSFINILDALNGWQLVRELRLATGLPAATSFKHVSPAGAAVAGAITDQELEAFDVEEPPASLIANAYLRAREADLKSSFGDFVAVSERVDVPLATLLKSVVSDGIIAPGFDDETLPILRQKKGGNYLVLQIDPAYEPPALEERTVFGFLLRQERNSRRFTPDDIAEPVVGRLTDSAKLDLLVALCTLNPIPSYAHSMARQWASEPASNRALIAPVSHVRKPISGDFDSTHPFEHCDSSLMSNARTGSTGGSECWKGTSMLQNVQSCKQSWSTCLIHSMMRKNTHGFGALLR
jgi:phosphoribosylaminoimidazolecarboxamide formyltransferase/IMP cyclohydrolase